MERWRRVRKDLGTAPIVEGMINGATPLYMERYLFSTRERSVAGVSSLVLTVQLGGMRVKEGEEGHWRINSLASQSVLIPPRCPTHWHYNGIADFAVFYFPEHLCGVGDRLARLASARGGPLQFNDALVAASAVQMADELQKGGGADDRFLSMLAAVMLEQVYRALTGPVTGGIRPQHIHALRLQVVLDHIREHLADSLPVEKLAELAALSVAHFRRLFREAMGVPPHRYIQAARLQQARKLLATTGLPIARIAEDCGYSSQSHLSASFRAAHAATPAEFRAGAKP